MKAHRNPFAPGRVQRQLPFDPTLIGTDWETIANAYQAHGRRAIVWGRHGSGKSTFLETFRKRLAQETPVRVLTFRNEKRQLTAQDRETLSDLRECYLFVDGEGHLSRAECREVRRASQGARGYLAIRHLPGRLPTLLHLKSSPRLARALLQRIDEAAFAHFEKELPRLLRKKNGNLRELWLSLYDSYAFETPTPPLAKDPSTPLFR